MRLVAWFGLVLLTSIHVEGRDEKSCAGLLLSEQMSAHKAITEDLFNGTLSGVHPYNANDNKQLILLADIHNANSGRKRKAIVKPRELGDRGGYARNTMEYVAYYINRLLGMDYVPPTAYRLNGISGFDQGSVAYFVEDLRVLSDVREEDWNIDPDVVRSDWRVLNVLLQNPDGHYKNLGHGPHWVDGIPRPVFMDFGASFRGEIEIRMDHYPVLNHPIKTVSRSTYDGLKKLKYGDLNPLIGFFITHTEAEKIINTARGIVHYFDQLD